MIKLTHYGRSSHSFTIHHGCKSISVDRIPLTLTPFYRDYLLEMQNSQSDPALRPSRSPQPASGCATRTSIISQPSVVSKLQPAGADDTRARLLACFPADQATLRLRRALDRGSAARAETRWLERNFPRVRRSVHPLGACAGLMTTDEEEAQGAAKAAARVIGREVSPQQFVLSFNKTKG